MMTIIALVIFGLLATIPLSFIMTIIYVWRHPDAVERWTAKVDQLGAAGKDPHAEGEECPGDACEQCKRADQEADQATWASLRALAGMAWILPAGVVYVYGPRLGRWLLRGRTASDRKG